MFVITGILDSLLREECTDLCKEYGARVVGAVSGRVTHGIVGLEPGASKIAKLKANRTPTISEDELFDMINRSRKNAKEEEKKEEKKEDKKEDDVDMECEIEEVKPAKKSADVRMNSKSTMGSSKSKTSPVPRVATVPKSTSAMLWVDKYRPSSQSDLIANNKAIRDLSNWLGNWKRKFLFGDGHTWKVRERSDSDYAAALLVGPPGIGKTSAAYIVCRDAGFEPHEFNASDVRNKGGVQMLGETVMVANTLSKYLSIQPAKNSSKSSGKVASSSYPEGQVLIMDEVDGMSGGDRGGGQELIRMIKKSKVPIICIANDDSSANMRSLSGNCFKIRFRRPMVTQVTKRLVEIARREGFHALQDQTLAKLAEGCNGDIRQMINLLQTWRVASPSLSFTQVKDRLQVEGKTVVQKSVFELAKNFFSPGIDQSNNSLIARTDAYFTDSDIMPLFVQENYVHTVAASHSLDALADAAECISEGDLCNTLVRGEQRWDLMPSAAVLTSLRPGCLLAGGLGGQPMFPSFLGNLSKGNKWKRIIQGLEMKVKAVKTSSGSTRSFRLDYIPTLTTCLATPLIRSGAAGISEVVERLDSYYLERDPDWIEILEAGVYGKGRSPLDNIKPAVKTAFTKEYNAASHGRSSVTGCRVGVKATDGTSFRKSAATGGGEDVAVVDDDVAYEVEKEDESDVEDVVKEFGARVKRKAKGGASKGKKKAPSGRSRGRGARGGKATGRGRGRGKRRS